MQQYDLVIVGGGLAGLASAIAAKEEGIKSIIVLEREEYLGGYLNQCVHLGYKSQDADDELTGTEYVHRLVSKVRELNIAFKTNTLAMEINNSKIISIANEEGINEISAKAIILACGSREKPRGTINIATSKSAGIFTMGTAQRIVNLEGYMPGKNMVIVGSSDSSLIMVKQLVLEGAIIKALVEHKPCLNASKENIEESVNIFRIPVKTGYSLIDIKGRDRVESVTIAKVDENRVPIVGTEELINCDTVLLSMGLLPEVELAKKAGIAISDLTGGPSVNQSMETAAEGIFACGDILFVHGMEENVELEGYKAGSYAAAYIMSKR